MKNPLKILTISVSALLAISSQAQNTFTGDGNWLDPTLWDTGIVPPDGSTAIINGTALIDVNIVTTQVLNPSRVEIGNGLDEIGILNVTGGTLSGAHGGGGIYVGLNGGTGTLNIGPDATFRSQGANMIVRIGDDLGGTGEITVEGVLQTYKFLELINGTLRMMPSGQNNLFNSNNASFIGPDGTLAFVIDGAKVGALKRSNATGLNLTIDPASQLHITLDGTFAINDSWVLMDYTNLTGQFAQGTSFTNQQGYTFGIDYGSGAADLVTLTLSSDDQRPKIDTITATPAAISSGESSTIAWDASNFDSLTLDPGGLDVTALSASVVMPAATTTYTLTADKAGVLVSRDLTVIVDELPEILNFAASDSVIAPGDSSTLSWEVAGATTVTINPNPGAVDLIDSSVVMPDLTTEYTLTATNSTGSVNSSVTISVDALNAALIHQYDPAASKQTSGAMLDPTGGKNFDMTGGNLLTGLTSPATSLTAAMTRVNPNANTGGDNGLGFPETEVTFEFWVQTADLDDSPQVLFESGSPDDGTSILVNRDSARFMHSVGGITTLDLEAPMDFINTLGDLVQITAVISGSAGHVDLFVRGAGGGTSSASGDGTIGVPNGRASIFTWSGFGGGILDALGGIGPEAPLGTTTFRGTIGLFNVYNRPFSEAEVDETFLRIADAIIPSDVDEDLLPDWWEQLYFMDLDEVPSGDPDGESLTNAEELENRTNPTLADTDADGLDDDVELFEHQTDPNNPDTDNDLLGDAEEINGDPATDPTFADSDFDGYWDVYELCLGSDPNDEFDLPSDDIGEPFGAIHLFGAYASLDTTFLAPAGDDATFRLFVDFDEKTDGEREVLFETGGNTTGTSLVYEAGNQLEFRSSGNGGLTVAVVTYVLTPTQIAAGELDIVCSYDVDDGGEDFASILNLFVDGVLVSSETAILDGVWTGNNNAAFGSASTNMAGDGLGNALTGLDFTSGAINQSKGLAHYPLLFIPEVSTFIKITDLTHNPDTNEITLSFDSEPGKTYAVSSSSTLTGFGVVLAGVNSGGTTTTTDPIAAPDPAAFYFITEE